MATKQVIVIRTDLRMRRGKEIAQGAHASGLWLYDHVLDPPVSGLTREQMEWLEGNYRKVTVQVDSEEVLRELHRQAILRGMTAHVVTDNGLTEIPAGTATALAIGPHDEERFVGLTDGLKLY